MANFHTHPLSSLVKGDPQPSDSDHKNAWHRGVPGLVLSRDGIYAYGPERRENRNNPKGYPGQAVDPPSYFIPKLVKKPQPPWVVKNQWPEGEKQLREERVEMAGGEVVGEESVDSEVAWIEWSDEGVEYGEQLEERED